MREGWVDKKGAGISFLACLGRAVVNLGCFWVSLGKRRSLSGGTMQGQFYKHHSDAEMWWRSDCCSVTCSTFLLCKNQLLFSALVFRRNKSSGIETSVAIGSYTQCVCVWSLATASCGPAELAVTARVAAIVQQNEKSQIVRKGNCNFPCMAFHPSSFCLWLCWALAVVVAV